MRFSAGRLAPLFCTAIAATMLWGTQPASSQYLFDRLFGGNRASRYDREMQQQPPPQQVRRAVAPKVAGPQYYTYKADALVKVDFATIAGAGVGSRDAMTTNSVTEAPGSTLIANATPLQPALAPSARAPFSQAMDGLAEYDLRAEKEIAEALVSHYSAKPDFIWVTGDQPSHRAEAALATLRDAGSHGLDAADYSVPDLSAATQGEPQRLAEAARFEMALSARVLRYVRDAHRGRIDPNRISGYHDFAQKPLDFAHVLEVLSDTFAVGKYLESWHPQSAQYATLRTELAELKRSQENEIVVDPQTFLRPGGMSPELAKILALIEREADDAMRAEFGPLLFASKGREIYSEDLVPLIKAAQAKAGLKADGVIGPRTVAGIAGNSKADRQGKVVVALEQLRWLPQQLGSRHVFINVPAFEANYVEGGERKLSMRTVVGKNATQTYFFQDEIDYVEFHPYWGIPRSILINTYLPKLYDDPSYLDRIGYEVTDSRGRQISSSSIDWAAYGSNIPFDVRQPPGPKNSLGEMKIMFPNAHAIYMHDTPEKNLFDRESRNFSNGCVRLQDPRGMAAAVLGWDPARIEERLKGKNGQVKLDVKVPVYVAYFTAWPDANGTVTYHHDVYARDSYMQKALDRVAQVRAPVG